MAKPKPRARKRRSPLSRLSPSRGVVTLVLSVVSLLLLGSLLLVESVLLMVVSGLSVLATVLQVRWSQQRAAADLKRAAANPGARRARPTTKAAPAPKPDGDQPAPPAGGVVLCTETGTKVEDCKCASRHVATADGSRRYGLPVGSPMGRRAKRERPAATVRG